MWKTVVDRKPYFMRSRFRACLMTRVMCRCCRAVSPVMRRGRIFPVSVTKRERISVSVWVRSKGFFWRVSSVVIRDGTQCRARRLGKKNFGHG
jgi:hypothetical protein